jgi:hypothetical protein
MAEANGNRASRGNLMKAIGSIISLLRDILAELKKLNSKEPEPITYKGINFSGSLDDLAKEMQEKQNLLKNNERKPGNKGYNNNKTRGN